MGRPFREYPEELIYRMTHSLCLACCKPKSKWTRRKDWQCCSTECTQEYVKFLQTLDNWTDTRNACLKRDKYMCVKCRSEEDLEVDHILPIALDGAYLDLNNLQTLCYTCHKIKTKKDIKEIAKARKR